MKNSTIRLSYKFKSVKRIDFNYTFVKAYAPYNSTLQSPPINAEDTTRIQLTWVHR